MDAVIHARTQTNFRTKLKRFERRKNILVAEMYDTTTQGSFDHHSNIRKSRSFVK